MTSDSDKLLIYIGYTSTPLRCAHSTSNLLTFTELLWTTVILICDRTAVTPWELKDVPAFTHGLMVHESNKCQAWTPDATVFQWGRLHKKSMEIIRNERIVWNEWNPLKSMNYQDILGNLRKLMKYMKSIQSKKSKKWSTESNNFKQV